MNSVIIYSFLWFPIMAAGSAYAETISDLSASGFEVLWEGYAAVTTCVHDQDHYELGQYIFACDQYTYEYPYHYGSTFLLARILDDNAKVVSSFLCLEKEEDCFQGSLFKK